MFVCLWVIEERARIYSSDSDEGSDEDKAQRLMKAKRLDSDEVNISDRIDSLRNKNNQNWNGNNGTTMSITVTSRVSAALVTDGYFPFSSVKRSKP